MAHALVVLLILFLAGSAGAAEDALTNRVPAPGVYSRQFTPGAAILLPDGRQAIIQEILPDGQWRTNLGVITPPDGFGPGARIVLPDGQQITIEELLPNGQWRTDVGVLAPPEGATLVQPKKPEQKSPNLGQMLPGQQVKPETATPQDPPKAAEKPQTPRYYTLAELLPKTGVPDKPAREPEKKSEEKAIKPETKAKEAKEPAPKLQEKQPEPKARQHEKKPEKKAEKPKPGQELRIPEHAAKTGNLDFLEGCWQGTRPEYYSKRTIKECFCFDAGGKNGKRRVLDYTQRRTCIGASRATLSGNGVLRVISSGAVCNDGERWGQAEMMCRNSGPRTPCSWVFRDAQNGRQSYEIPFVRVESCGR